MYGYHNTERCRIIFVIFIMSHNVTYATYSEEKQKKVVSQLLDTVIFTCLFMAYLKHN